MDQVIGDCLYDQRRGYGVAIFNVYGNTLLNVSSSSARSKTLGVQAGS